MYLNKIYFVLGEVYGIEWVVEKFYGVKSVKDLIFDEVVMLVGLLKVLIIYNLVINSENVIKCCNIVLNLMVKNGFII